MCAGQPFARGRGGTGEPAPYSFGVKPTTPAAAVTHALLASIVQSTDDGVVTVTLDGKVTSVNPAAAAMFGYPPRELVGRSVLDVAVPERVAAATRILARLRRGEQIRRYRTVLLRKDGTRFPVSLTVSLVPGDAGTPPLASAIIQDLSEEIHAEETRALLAAIVQSSEDAIYSRAPDGPITSWNRSAERLFGYARDEILGRSIRMLVPPDVEREFEELDTRLRSGRAVSDQQTIRVTKDGRRIPVSITAFPVIGDEGSVTGFAMITRDMLRSAETHRAFRNLERLTGREREVLGLVAYGLPNIEISVRLGLSQQTVKNYVSRILMKLDVTTRTQAAASFLSLRSFLGPPKSSE
jgi:PAS domain S-box-containing protein